MIHELYDMAGQHDMIADNLNADVMAKLLTCIQELKQDRKKVRSVSRKFIFAFNSSSVVAVFKVLQCVQSAPSEVMAYGNIMFPNGPCSLSCFHVEIIGFFMPPFYYFKM